MKRKGSVKSLCWLAGGIILGLLLSLALILWGNEISPFLSPQSPSPFLWVLSVDRYFQREAEESLRYWKHNAILPPAFALSCNLRQEPLQTAEEEKVILKPQPEDQIFWAWDDFLSQRFQTETQRLEERLSHLKSEDFLTASYNLTPELSRLQILAVSCEDNEKIALFQSEEERIQARLSAFREENFTRPFRQIKLQWERLQKSRNWGESFWAELEAIAAEWDRLSKIPITDSALLQEGKDWADPFFAQRERLQKLKPFLMSLSGYDSLSLDPNQAQAFLLQKAKEAPESLYASEFTASASAWDVFPLLQKWNQFVRENGEGLAHFAVAPKTAFAAVRLYVDEKDQLSFIPDWKRLPPRMEALSITAREISFQSEIETILAPWAADRFVFVPSPHQFFYLDEKPHLGENRYQSDLFGQKKYITLSSEDSANEKILNFSDFFRRRIAELSEIPDNLRIQNYAAWFDRYGELVKKIKENESLDPLVRFYLLQDIKDVLASGDYYFEKELAVWNRYFKTPSLEKGVDYFDSENESVLQNRQLAAEILTAFPISLRTGAEIVQEYSNSGNANFYSVYELVGWLDADLTGVWFFRSSTALPEDKKRLSGKLYLFLPESAHQDASPAFRAFEAGEMKEGIGEISLISDDLKRGLPVFCRIKAE